MTLTQGSTPKPLHTHSVLQATETARSVGQGLPPAGAGVGTLCRAVSLQKAPGQEKDRGTALWDGPSPSSALEEAPWNEQWLKGSASAVWKLNSVLHFCQFSETNMFFLNIQAILMVSFHIYLDDFLGCYQIWYTFILEGCICLKFSQCVFIKKTKGKQEYFTKQVTK